MRLNLSDFIIEFVYLYYVYIIFLFKVYIYKTKCKIAACQNEKKRWSVYKVIPLENLAVIISDNETPESFLK